MPRSERISPAQWDAHKDHIHSLYINQDKTLDEVMHHMSQEYNFHASKSQYIRRITVVWKMKKNFTKTQWEQAHSLISKRKAEGKSTELVMGGTIVPRKRLKKELKRYPVSQTGQSDAFQDLPCDMVARTPPELELNPVTPNAIHELQLLDPVAASASPDPIKRCSAEPGLVVLNSSTWGNSSWQHYLTAGKNFNPSYLVNQLLQNTLPTSQMSWSTGIALTNMVEMITGTYLRKVDSDLEALPAMTSEQWNTFLPDAISLSARGLLRGSALDELLRLAIGTGAITSLSQAIALNDPMIRIFASNLLISAIRVCKNTDLVHSLLQRGVSPDSTEASCAKYGGPRKSALQTAVIHGNQPAVRLLLDYRADPNLTCQGNQDYPLSIALKSRKLSPIAEILINKGADESQAGGPEVWSRKRVPIIQATENQDTARVKQLTQAGADPNTLTSIGVSALHIAIRCQDLETVRALLEAEADPNILCGDWQCSSMENARNHLVASSPNPSDSLTSPIRAAADKGNREIVRLLLAAEADIDGYIDPDLFSDLDPDVGMLNMLENASRTALQTAILKSDTAMVKFLLMEGANPNAGHHTVSSPLQLACGLKEPSPQKLGLIKLLLEWGADVNAPATNPGGKTALQSVIDTGRLDLARVLLRCRETVSADLLNEHDFAWLEVAGSDQAERMLESLCQRAKLQMDLQAAVKSGFITGVRQLLDAGGDINGQSAGRSLLCESIWQEDTEMVDFLLSKGIHPDPKDADPTPLWAAIHQQNWQMVRWLLKAGAEPNRPSSHICHNEPSKPCYNRLIDECYLGRFEPKPEPEIETPLTGAVLRGRVDLVQMLVAAGASVNPSISDSLGPPPLVLAVRDRAWQIAHLLLHHGADPNATGRNSKMTALHYTLSDVESDYDYEKLRMCKILIDSGADANAPSEKGSPIQLAFANWGFPTEREMLEVLLDAGADVNAPATEGFPMTPLQKAVETLFGEYLSSLLLEEGADLHAPAFWKGGSTALQVAAKAEKVELVNKFISLGVDVNALPAREKGATALQFAAMRGNIDIAKILVESGANINAPRAEIDGRTALEGAAEHGQFDMVYFLLENDDEDDADLVEKRCHDAAAYAETEGHFMLAGMLREWKKPENDGERGCCVC